MKKEWKVVLISVCLIILVLPGFADIGENFQKSGLGFGGGGRLYTDRSLILQDGAGSLRGIYLYPEFMLFILDQISASFSPSFSYIDNRIGVNYKLMNIGLEGSLLYYWVRYPERQKGFVPGFGLNLGLDTQFDITNDYFYMYVDVGPQIRLYYFLTDRFSPYCSFIPAFDFLVLERYDGSTVDLEMEDRLQVEVNTVFGFIYHIPSRGPLELKTD
jgi:hypothetical protein